MPMSPRLLRPIAGRAIPPQSFLLDSYAAGAVGYGTGVLAASYAGPAITVRRSSDSAEQSFTAAQVASGEVAAWVGAGNDGFISGLFDQGTGAKHTGQTTASLQPRIVSGGVMETAGGIVAPRYDGGDYLTRAADPSFAFGTGDFTAEFWLRVVSFGGQSVRVTTSAFSTNFAFEVTIAGQLALWDGSTFRTFGSTGAVSAGAWAHVAWCRSAGSLRVFLNGVQAGSTVSVGTNMSNTQAIQFVATASYSSAVCYMNNLVLSKTAKYTSPFTPSSQ